MTYQKRCPSYLFNGYELFSGKKVLITDQDGEVIDIIRREDAGEDVQDIDGLICPGFINAHCHLELSHMKGMIGEGQGMTGFISSLVIQRFAPKEKILQAIAEAEEEMVRNGIVAVGDICNSTDTYHQKEKKNLLYFNFIEALGLDPTNAGKRFTAAEDVYVEMAKLDQSISIVPHAPYSVSDELFRLISQHSAGKTISCHNQESNDETDFLISGEGAFRQLFLAMNIPESILTARHKRSLQAMLPYFSSASKVLLVHNVVTNEEDFSSLQVYDPARFYWCLCPNANLYITGMLPDLRLILENTDQVVLGTDSLASNDSLSVLKEMKTIVRNFEWVQMEDILKWATLNGARALGMDDKLGSFKKGTNPGINLIQGLEDGRLCKDSIVTVLH